MEEEYKIIKKILGEINPVGETYEDSRRGINLDNTIKIVNMLIQDLIEVSGKRDRVEYSIKQAGLSATKYLRSLEEDIRSI